MLVFCMCDVCVCVFVCFVIKGNSLIAGRITDDVKTVINMVRKDVLRTDRKLQISVI